MNKKDRERIEYIKKNGDGYVMVQQDLTGKKKGQTQFNIPGKRNKPRLLESDDDLKEWEKWRR